MRRALVAAVVLALCAAAPVAARVQLTGVCASVRAARITFDGKTVRVTTPTGSQLVRATRTTRLVSPACTRGARLGPARLLLDGSLARGRVLCPQAGRHVLVEVEPVRIGRRTIGSRVAVWQDGIAQEIAEVLVAGKRSWFLYARMYCHVED